ncbi:MAG: C39 family peptidase [Dehalococcoidia bacterium]|nr:C39 family peptidase [Dehalococcoidia bacterium]
MGRNQPRWNRVLRLSSSLFLFLAVAWLWIPGGILRPGPGLQGLPTAEAATLGTSRFFPQTGFFLRNRDGVSFLSSFDRLGGIDALGYPVSTTFEMGGFQSQAFQRGILQWRPESSSAVLANVMDQLNAMGKDDWLLSKGVPPHFAGPDGSDGDFARAKDIRLSWLTEPAIQRAYVNHPNPLSFYGLPTSRPERQGPFVTQRFQRGVLQLWVDDVRGMPRPGQVVGVLVGDLAKESGLAPAPALKPEYSEVDAEVGGITLPVPAFAQERNLSCESSAAAMAANYFGAPLREAQIVAAIPANPNPHLGFRGNVDGWFGGVDEYGVYAEPIAKVLADHGLNAEVVYGLSPQALREAISHNKVVVSWITYQVAVRTPTTRDINGEKVVLVPWEHAVAVKGYDAEGIYVNDPGTGAGAYYTNQDFARASGYFGGMAVIVSGG